MKPLNKGAERRTQGLLICLISFIITANFPWAPGSEPLPSARPYLPLHISLAPRRSPRALPGPSRRGLGEPLLPASLFRGPGARRRDEGQSKGSGLAAASLTAAFQRRTYRSEAFSEALISNLDPSPLWRGAFNLTSGNSAALPFFLHLVFIVFHFSLSFSSPPHPPHCPAHRHQIRAVGWGEGCMINRSFNSLLMITFSHWEKLIFLGCWEKRESWDRWGWVEWTRKGGDDRRDYTLL